MNVSVLMWLVRFARDLNKKINIEIVYLNQQTTGAVTAEAPYDWYEHLQNAKTRAEILDCWRCINALLLLHPHQMY